MSYEPTTTILFPDNGSLDAFGRLRVSEAVTIFDSKQLHDEDLLRWATKTTGTGTVTYTSSRVCSALSVVSGTDRSVRQTRQRFVYQPGRSMLFNMTGILSRTSVAAGAISRLGPHDDSNGLFFQLSGTTLSVVRRSGGSDVEVVPQSSWNTDKFDGTGPSGIVLDPTKTQIFTIDFQWLGVGAVRMGFSFGRSFLPCHVFSNANTLDQVYMLNPNLPIRYEVASTGGARTMDAICVSVSGESIVSPAGVAKSIDRGISTFTGVDAGELVPLVSMRLKSTHINAAVLPVSINVQSPTAAKFRLALLLNPTIAGVDAASWVSVPNSAVEYDISRTISNLASGGTQIFSDYGGGGPSANSPVAPGQNLDLQMRLGADVDGVRDQYVLCAEPITGTNESLTGVIVFRELL